MIDIYNKTYYPERPYFMQSLILCELKTATSAEHRLIEKTDILSLMMSNQCNKEICSEVLKRFYAFYLSWERNIADFIAYHSEVAYTYIPKIPLLETDLAELGISSEFIGRIIPFNPVPPVSNFEEFLASLYVMEGSTLGGQWLKRKMAKCLEVPGIQDRNTKVYIEESPTFFDPYPGRCRSRWETTCNFITDTASTYMLDHQRVSAAAVNVFKLLRRGMSHEQAI